jgi:hypothetical protein
LRRPEAASPTTLISKGGIQKFNNADGFISSLRQFKAMVRGFTILQSIFNETGAALLYDCDTASHSGDIRTAEFFRVQEGKIVEIRWVLMERKSASLW